MAKDHEHDHERHEHEDPERHGPRPAPGEIGDLLRTLIEVQVANNEMLAGLTRKLDRAICVLEHISRNTCETLNEVAALADCKEPCEPCEPCAPPEATCCGKPPAEGPKPCPPPEKHEPPCKYEPCEPGEEAGGSDVSKPGSAPPQRTFGAPYPPVVRPENPTIRANGFRAPRIPRGPFRGFLTPGAVHAPLNFSSGGAGGAGGDDPVVFGVYTNSGSVASPQSTVAADISGAQSGNIVLATGNWYILYSFDGGGTFTTLDPTTVFDNTADGGFCCDQIVQYVPSIDRFIWLMQFNPGADGKNRLRVASASPESVHSSKCTSWTYWDLTSDALGIVTTAADAKNGIHNLDYPNISVGTNYLYISVDNWSAGRIVVRISLSDISAGGTINFRYTDWSNGGVAYGSHVTQNTGDEAYWAGNKNNSTLTVFNWNENSTSYSWRDVGVNNWPNGTLSSTGASGADWLTKASSFPNAGVIGATRRNNEIWFAWMASSGTGAPGGFNFPNANVQVVKIDPTNNYQRIDQFPIWNNDYAFAYPALATNSQGEVGIALAWGGKTFDANSAVGILGDFVVWYPEASTFSTTRWGDFVTARQASPQTGLFAGFAYAILKDTTTTAGYRFDPYYLLFGRNSIINPGGGANPK
ncbi:hypothetical protein [Roseiarcus sp.]|uniref:hypothetical protein n=1 Tax=Roseiarcus sp. TaxID=1969460 RepID=UPI003F99B4FA